MMTVMLTAVVVVVMIKYTWSTWHGVELAHVVLSLEREKCGEG